jgi:4-deoxy-L-threo-5-hexosulose-uronate ketol-isomerase
MKTYLMPDPVRMEEMNTEQLRRSFLLDHLFLPGQISLVYLDVDRAVVGSAIPTAAPLQLGTDDALRSAYFAERRELGILNVGGKGTVAAADKAIEMDNLDCLYIGRGTREISFRSADPAKPAQFYIVSYPAHQTHPTVLAKKSEAKPLQLGSQATSNQRSLYKYIHPDGIKSCQLVMGFTVLAPGNAWNSMPPHTHMRRSEVYMYFDMPPEARVFHFMGRPQETRHLLIADRQAVVSPSWSIHCGTGTAGYSFCWAMGGENQVFDDMDAAPVATLR